MLALVPAPIALSQNHVPPTARPDLEKNPRLSVCYPLHPTLYASITHVLLNHEASTLCVAVPSFHPFLPKISGLTFSLHLINTVSKSTLFISTPRLAVPRSFPDLSARKRRFICHFLSPSVEIPGKSIEFTELHITSPVFPSHFAFTLLPFYPSIFVAVLYVFLSLSAPGSTQNTRSLHLSTLASTRTAAALTAVRIKQPLLNRASRRRFPIIRPHIAAASTCCIPNGARPDLDSTEIRSLLPPSARTFFRLPICFQQNLPSLPSGSSRPHAHPLFPLLHQYSTP